MKRLTASALSLALVLAAFPAEAQVVLGRASLGTGVSAPAIVPAGIAAPVAGLSAPAALTPSLVPALAAAPSAPSPLIAAAALAVAASPLKAAPAAIAPVSASSPAPMRALETAATPKIGALAFDGGRLAASTPDPVDAGPRAEAPRKSWLQRYKDSRKDTPPLQTAFGKGMALATTLTVAAPAVLLMAPALKIGYALAASYLLMTAVLLPMTIGGWALMKFRKSPAAARPPTRARLLATALLGAMVGLGLGVTPYMATGPAAERVEMYLDRNRAPADQEHVRWIHGGVVEAETVKVLSANPIGRDTLKKLEDRFGVLRLPRFFVSRQDDSYAQHESFYDGVYFNESEITGRGWTVDQFLNSPELQRRFIREMDSTTLHELTHAVQGRRAPWKPSYFKNSVESEQEAFFQEMLYRFAALEADPNARNNGHDQWMIPDAADSFDGFLKSVREMYEKNVVVGTDPDYNAYFAAQRARWPVFRVHVYQVLAARSQPGMAKIYMEKARKAALEAGLPEPSPSLAGR